MYIPAIRIRIKETYEVVYLRKQKFNGYLRNNPNKQIF